MGMPKLHDAIAKLLLPQDIANHFVFACVICTVGMLAFNAAVGAGAAVSLIVVKDWVIDDKVSWPDVWAGGAGLAPPLLARYGDTLGSILSAFL